MLRRAKVWHEPAVPIEQARTDRSAAGVGGFGRIEVGEDRGWRWDELNGISRAVGGATPAEIDAFRLLAVFLGHWDSKAENQRLLCVGEPVTGDGCRRPVAMIQDLGASFGPKKLNVGHWEATPIWDDAATCRVSLRHLPDGVQTFPDIRISEAGRRFLGSRLARLTPRQVRSLFGGAHIEQFAAPDAESRSADRWAAAFATKVRAITERSSCP